MADTTGGARVRMRPAGVALWAAALVVAGVRIRLLLLDPALPGVPWQTAPPQLLDFRDLIFGPGRFLLSGGNPYDPQTYLPATPGAQEFGAYAPAWLLLSASFGWMPFQASALVFELAMLAVAVGFCLVLARWADRSSAWWTAPVLLTYLNLWYPGRASLESGGTLIAAFGVLLALRQIGSHAGGVRGLWLGSVGVALALVKPQFGLPLAVLLLICSGWSLVWRGIAIIAAASIPAGVASLIAAGGPMPFLASLSRVVTYSSSPAAPTGLASPFLTRVDLVGLLARQIRDVPPVWVQVALPLSVLCVGVFVLVRRDRLNERWSVPLAVCATIVLVIVHSPYDLVILTIPMLLGAPVVVRRLRDRGFTGLGWEHLAWLLAVAPVLHVHAIALRLFSLSRVGLDMLDVAAIVLSLAALLVAATRPPATRPEPAAAATLSREA